MPRQTRSQSRTPSSSSSSSGRDHPGEEGPLQAKDDKENCVEKSDFQPPSPLTSKRHKAKNTAKAKKILSPNRNNQWSQRERLRSSPIEAASSYSHHHHHHHQDRDFQREAQRQAPPGRSTSNLKREMYTMGGELDLKSDDDFGPSIEDCLNLGSFAEDSPPRDKSSIYRRPPDPRGSPTYPPPYNYGSRAGPPPPPDYSRHAPPPPMYYGAPPPGYSTGYPPADYPPWQSPRPYSDAYGRGAAPHKPYEGSPPSKKSRRWDGLQTPDKSKKSRSPFRSPMPDSAKKFKRSPIWGGPGTPNIGMYGSFGMMDTPGAQLDGFSPMGPAFASFENDSPPLPMEGEVLDDRLSLVAGDDAMRAPPSIRQRTTDGGSFNFIDEMAHMPGTTIQGSPVRPSRYYSSGEKDRRGGHPPVKRPPPGTVTKRHIFASPLATSHSSSSRRAPWYDHSRQGPPPPGPMRMELSDMGSRASETRRSLEGINTMLRGGAAAPPPPPRQPLAHPGAPPPPPPGYDQRGQYRDLNTPVKIGGPPPPRMPPSSQSRGHAPPAYPGPAPMSGRKAPPMSASVSRYPQPSPQVRPPSSAQRVHSSSKITPSASEKMTPVAAKRNPCNCKKTKCLKLYCECFAAELYCDGCNCSDCHNSKTHEDVRSKAMKDTRAKNPNAFKPRIAVTAGQAATPSSAHNMGCKCKRSECLKKYCECFQAGVMCGNKCKCVDCLNYVGSQALIDKLRKIKDHRGADFAMRLADEAWKGKHGRGTTPARRLPSPARAKAHHMPPQHHMPSSGGRGPYMGYPYPPSMGGHAGGHAAPQFSRSDSRSTSSRPSSRSSETKKAPARDPTRPSSKELLAKATAQRPRKASPTAATPAESSKPPAVTPATTTAAVKTESPSSTPAPSTAVNEPAAPIKATASVPIKMEPDVEMTDQTEPAAPTPAPKASAAATPRTPGVRLGYDPYSSKKKRRLRPGEKEVSFAYFGDCPQQPKTTALAVFSFLTNQEICKARLVSKQWSSLGMDEELWQF